MNPDDYCAAYKTKGYEVGMDIWRWSRVLWCLILKVMCVEQWPVGDCDVSSAVQTWQQEYNTCQATPGNFSILNVSFNHISFKLKQATLWKLLSSSRESLKCFKPLRRLCEKWELRQLPMIVLYPAANARPFHYITREIPDWETKKK